MKKETSRRGLFEKAAWSAAAALALSCPAVAADSCCGGGDWLLDPSRYKAVVREAGGAWILENGLARREIATRPGAATTSFKCLATGEEFVRGVSPEARVTFDGVEGAEGPGRLTKLLNIDRSLNREDLVRSDRLWLETDGSRVKFTAAPRIGIAYASKRDQKRKWRFTSKRMKGT